MNTNKKPELLAPAGNLNCAMAALQSGADAVYAGISRFNAREMGENFSFEDMSRLSEYTKKNNRRFYLTLNTLVKENELEEFGEAVEKISALDPDAVIVQDIGVSRFLRECFPGLSIHASTQMGIHNSLGVKAAAGMGMDRVILERQVTMGELEAIVQASPVEIEVFVHGALCCSVSGHCLFSSWLGGWSGNRGRCKQPCRRRFHGSDGGKKQSGFFFSTQDFYSLDMLDELERIGVSSLKIEGRLKKPDYVRQVVTAYRMVLDAPADRKQSVLGEARSVLAGSYGRKWSHGFASPEDMSVLIQHDSLGVSGRLTGSVEKTARNGFSILVSQRLHVGDRIRIQPKSGDEGPAITVTRMSAGHDSVKTAVKGSSVFIHCDKKVSAGSLVYKIGESRAEEVKIPADMPLYTRKTKADLNIAVSHEGVSVRLVSVNDLPVTESVPEWTSSFGIEEADKLPLAAETVVEAFSATRDSSLALGKCSVDITGNLFLPAGTLKKVRREFWEWLGADETFLSTAAAGFSGDTAWKAVLEKEFETWQAQPPQKLPAESTVYASGNKNHISSDKTGTIRCADINADPSSADEIMLPFFCPEFSLKALRGRIIAADEAGIKRFRVTSLYQLQMFRELELDGLTITAAFPLPAANSLAAKELNALGADRVQIWLELDREAAEAMAARSPVAAEVYREGKPFLLATRASVSAEGRINDSRGKVFFIEKGCSDLAMITDGQKEGGMAFVFPEEVLRLPAISGCSEFCDRSRIKAGDPETGFNYDFSLI